MTYFPAPDPEKLRQAMYQASFLQTPPASGGLPNAGDEWPANTPTQESFHDPAAYSWPTRQPTGLGLSSVPTTAGLTEQVYHDAMSAARSVTMPFSWPSELSGPSMAGNASLHAATTGAWSYDCTLASTLPPSTVLWDPMQQSMNDSAAPFHETSPSLSNYSTSSRLSAASSPYAHSEGYAGTAESPLIKLEEPLERAAEYFNTLPDSASMERTLLVNPGDLVHHPPRNATTSLLPALETSSGLEEEADVKPVVPGYSFRVHHQPHHTTANLLPAFETSPGLDEEADVKTTVSRHSTGPRRTNSEESLYLEFADERQKRAYTKPENASCSCDQCGKLFQRSYNLKAHLETHDPHRSQPHACPYAECSKRFVRRTDLLRHEQSVHLKARNYPCHLCGSSFARKDTLRRHVDDGCPKRPEVRRRMTNKARRPSQSSASRRSSFQFPNGGTTVPTPLKQHSQLP